MILAFTFLSTITINISSKYQTIEGFSASDAWIPNNVGKYWNESEKEGIARLLFSTEIQDHQPQGIGLSMWRFDVGGCTADQGDSSDIPDINRRAECFFNTQLQYDFENKHKGQKYFIRKAFQYGCQKFVLFSNSPPFYYTFNGKGYSGKGPNSNLRPEYYQSFAQYLADTVYYFERIEGIPISYVSPVNEPQYNWDNPTQEGTGWQNVEVSALVRELDAALENRGIKDAQILLGESGDWIVTYEVKDDKNRNLVMDSFFNPTYADTYVGSLKHVAKIIGAHSYWTDTNWDDLKKTREKVDKKAVELGLTVFQTEWSMLSGSYASDEFPGFDKATELDVALYMSKVIHNDLVVANAASWSYWTSIDSADDKGRYHLVRIILDESGDIRVSGGHEASKTLWVLGQFSRFVLPGYRRVDAVLDDSSKFFFGSAYISQDESKLVVVMVNCKEEEKKVDLKLIGIVGKNVKSVKSYTTSENENLFEREIDDFNEFTLQGKSITTFTFEFY